MITSIAITSLLQTLREPFLVLCAAGFYASALFDFLLQIGGLGPSFGPSYTPSVAFGSFQRYVSQPLCFIRFGFFLLQIVHPRLKTPFSPGRCLFWSGFVIGSHCKAAFPGKICCLFFMRGCALLGGQLIVNACLFTWLLTCYADARSCQRLKAPLRPIGLVDTDQ